jgi:DNA repair exonuclease SbcCD nuclease subunit
LGFDYVLAGHFHRAYDVRQYDGGYFVYPGSPVSITRAETGRRHAVVVDAGEPPRPVPLDTVHVERVGVVVKPFDRVTPEAEIRRRLDSLHPKAKVYLTVDGYADVDAMKTTERELSASIRQFESDPRVVETTSRWRSVGDIMQHQLFSRFEAHLEEADTPGDHKDAVREMVIDALAEAIDAD